METAEIHKAKLSGAMGLSASYTEEDKFGVRAQVSKDYPAPIHADLLRAFKKLNIHLGVISEIIPAKKIKNIEDPEHELLDSFTVTAFEILEHETGVKLEGDRKLSTGKHLMLKTPAVKWNDKKKYEFAGDLSSCLEELKMEINQYLFFGKKAPDLQPELPGLDGNMDDFISETLETPIESPVEKKKSKKKAKKEETVDDFLDQIDTIEDEANEW